MFDEDCVYDTTGNREYYRDYIEKESRRSLFGWLAAALIMILGGFVPFIILGMEEGKIILPVTLLTILGGGFGLYISISVFRRERKALRDGDIGVRVDAEALEFFGIRPKRFELSEIDSVVIGEDFRCWGCSGRRILIKTLNPSQDGTGYETYSWDMRFVMDAEKFGDCLACNGVDVFYKKNGNYRMRTKSETIASRRDSESQRHSDD